MKKISLAIAVLSVSMLVAPALVGAQAGGVSPVSPPASVNLVTVINTVLNWAFGLLLVLAGIFILYAGFVYLTGGGSDESQKTAKKLIIFAVVAIIVGFLARGLVLIVRQLLGT